MCNLFRNIIKYFRGLDCEYYSDSIENLKKYQKEYEKNIKEFYTNKKNEYFNKDK